MPYTNANTVALLIKAMAMMLFHNNVIPNMVCEKCGKAPTITDHLPNTEGYQI